MHQRVEDGGLNPLPFAEEAATLANYRELAIMYRDFIKFFAKWGYLSVLKVVLRIVESRVRARAKRQASG